MGNLPKDKIEPSRPFQKVGLDYFGPLLIKEGGKAIKKTKVWAALFVCLVTRAVDLEIFLKNENTLREINGFFMAENISRNFTPPRAPHFGGI